MISFLSLVKVAALADWAEERDDMGSFSMRKAIGKTRIPHNLCHNLTPATNTEIHHGFPIRPMTIDRSIFIMYNIGSAGHVYNKTRA